MCGLVNHPVEIEETLLRLAQVLRWTYEYHAESRQTGCRFGVKRLRHQLNDGNQAGEFVREMRFIRSKCRFEFGDMPASGRRGVTCDCVLHVGFVGIRIEILKVRIRSRFGVLSAQKGSCEVVNRVAYC